jgi:hypothetical protein
MRSERLGGNAMITAAVMALVMMAFHPTGHDVARDPEGQGLLAVVVHSIILTSVPIAFFGAMALTRRLSPEGALAELALVFQGASSVAGLVAATVGGLLAPSLMEYVIAEQGDARVAADAVMHFAGHMIHTFSMVFVAASSVAIALWSIEILRTRKMRRSSGIVGCIVGSVTLLMLFAGHLHMDVHGLGAVILGQTLWLVLVGLELRRGSTA